MIIVVTKTELLKMKKKLFFFHKFLGFTETLYTIEKTIKNKGVNFTGKEALSSKIDFFEGSIMNGRRQPIFSTFT